MSDPLGYARDSRTTEQMHKNIIKGNILGRMAIVGLNAYFKFKKGKELNYKILEDEFWSDESEFKSHPDAIIYGESKETPIEVKCLLDGVPEMLDIRVTKSLIESRDTGYLYISECRKFTLIPMKDVLAKESFIGGRWNKRIVVLKMSDYAWMSHVYEVFDGWLDRYKTELGHYYASKSKKY